MACVPSYSCLQLGWVEDRTPNPAKRSQPKNEGPHCHGDAAHQYGTALVLTNIFVPQLWPVKHENHPTHTPLRGTDLGNQTTPSRFSATSFLARWHLVASQCSLHGGAHCFYPYVLYSSLREQHVPAIMLPPPQAACLPGGRPAGSTEWVGGSFIGVGWSIHGKHYGNSATSWSRFIFQWNWPSVPRLCRQTQASRWVVTTHRSQQRSDFTQVVSHTVNTLLCLSAEAAACGLGGVPIPGIIKTQPHEPTIFLKPVHACPRLTDVGPYTPARKERVCRSNMQLLPGYLFTTN